MNKKGNAVIDSLNVVVVLTVLAVIVVVGFTAFGELNTELQVDDDFSNESKQVLTDIDNDFPGLWDGLFLFALILLWISAIVFSFFIDTHPVFLVLSFILITFVLVVAAILTNSYEEIAGDTYFATAANALPIMTFIMGHLVETILVVAMSVAIALFAKSRT